MGVVQRKRDYPRHSFLWPPRICGKGTQWLHSPSPVRLPLGVPCDTKRPSDTFHCGPTSGLRRLAQSSPKPAALRCFFAPRHAFSRQERQILPFLSLPLGARGVFTGGPFSVFCQVKLWSSKLSKFSYQRRYHITLRNCFNKQRKENHVRCRAARGTGF